MPRLRWLAVRLRALLARERVEAELDDEFRFHLEMETAKNVAEGLSAEEAKRRALVAFGGVERYREAARDARGVRPVEDAWQDVRYGVRVVARTPVASLLVVLTLALAIGAGTTTYSLVSGVVLRSFPYRDADRLVMVTAARPGARAGRGGTLSSGAAEVLLSPAGAFASASAVRGVEPVLTGPGDPRRVNALRVGARFFGVFGSRPVRGRVITGSDVQEDARVVVVSHHFWVHRLGGTPDAVGRTLHLDGDPYEVVGVMPPRFELPSDVELWLPAGPGAPAAAAAAAEPGAQVQGRYWLVGRIAPGLTLEQATARLAVPFSAAFARWKPSLQPVPDLLVPAIRKPLLLLLAAVVLLLLLACANVAAVLLARGVARRREMAIRLAVGAGRGRVLRQLLTESLVLAALAGAAGVALTLWALPAAVALARAQIPRLAEIAVDWRVLGAALAATVATGLLAGILPAVVAVREAPSRALKEGDARSGASRSRLRLGGALLVVQVTLSTILVTAGTLLGVSFRQLTHVDLGFDADRVTVAQLRLPAARYAGQDARSAFVAAVLERARAIPGAGAATVASGIPLHGAALGAVEIPGLASPAGPRLTWFTGVTSGYFDVFGVRIVRGRALPPAGAAEPDAVLVNEAFVRAFFPAGDPLRRTVDYLGDVAGRITGVVSDVRQSSLADPPDPQLYFPLHAGAIGTYLQVAIRTAGDRRGTTAALEAAIRAVDPLMPIDEIGPMRDRVAESVAREHLYAVVFTAFSLIALLIAALGLYGLTAYTVRSRSREIGIRMALGATRRRVHATTVARTAVLAAAGVVLGLAGAAAAGRLLESMLFGVTARDPVVFAATAALLGAVAIVAAFVPATRAARVDPMAVLGAE